MPSKDIWPQIQEIREKYDKSYDRWMPHINLMFPFIHPDYFEDVYQKLSERLKTVEEFEIEFNELSYFPNNGYVWGKPEVKSNKGAIEELHKAITEVIVDQSGKDFTPHMTVGQFSNPEKSSKQLKWDPIKFTLSEIYMIWRNGKDAPFEIVKAVKLKEKK